LPLTISHPAAVIPLKKFGLPLSALTIGSMMPDFEFFLRFSSDRVIGHTIPGIFLFCLPVGFIILFLFQKVMKKPLLSLLPHSHRSRISTAETVFRFFPLKRTIKIISALLLGILSHLLFDSLTHENSFFTTHIPLLSFSIVNTQFGSVRVYFLLQQILSLTGFLIIVFWYGRWYKNGTNSKPDTSLLSRNQKRTILFLMMILSMITISIIVPIITFSGHSYHHTELYKAIISNTAVVSVSATLLVLLLYSICWHFFVLFSTKSVPRLQKE
jgi:hypothetical protein